MKVHLSINWILGNVLSAYDFMPFTNKYRQMSINQSLGSAWPACEIMPFTNKCRQMSINQSLGSAWQACEIMPFSGFQKWLGIMQHHQQAVFSFVGASMTQRWSQAPTLDLSQERSGLVFIMGCHAGSFGNNLTGEGFYKGNKLCIAIGTRSIYWYNLHNNIFWNLFWITILGWLSRK